MVHRHYTKVAKYYGVNASLLFYHIAYWVDQNRKEGKNMHCGKYWMYTTVQGLAETTFDYLTPNQIRYALDKLRESGLIMTGNFNKTTYDRTLWYTLSEEGERISGEMQREMRAKPNGML